MFKYIYIYIICYAIHGLVFEQLGQFSTYAEYISLSTSMQFLVEITNFTSEKNDHHKTIYKMQGLHHS